MATLSRVTPTQIVAKALVDMGTILASQTAPLGYTIGQAPPENPHNFLSLYDGDGFKDGRISRSGEPIIHYGIQLQIRHIDYGLGWTWGKEMQDFLSKIGNKTLTIGSVNVLFQNFTIQSSLTYVSTDELARSFFTINGFLTAREIN